MSHPTTFTHRYGPDILRWKCVACQAPYKDRKKYAKAGRAHLKDLHPEHDGRNHIIHDPPDDQEDWIVWWWCIPLIRAPLDPATRTRTLWKTRILCFFFGGFGACCVRRRKKPKVVHHGIDDEEHLTEGLQGCAKFFAIRKLLNHAASSLPAGSFAHDNCRRHPPSIKIALHTRRTVMHNIKVFKQNVRTRMLFEKFQNKCYKLFFVIALMAYPSASTRSLRIYQCDPIGDRFYLARDLSVECYDAAWSGWSAWSGMCIAMYVVGIPLGFFVLLHKAINRNLKQRWLDCRRNPNKLQALLKEAEIDAALTRRTYYKPTDKREEKAVAIHYLRIHNMFHHKTIERLGFVYAAYRPDTWWFEMVELMRKMVMNGLISIILPDSPTQIIIGIACAFGFMSHMLSVRPYKCESDHRLAFLCQLQIVVTLLAGLVLRERIPFLGPLNESWIHTDSEGKTSEMDSETLVCTVVIIVSHAGLLAFGFVAVVLEKWFSHEQQILNRKLKEHDLKLKRVQANTKSTMLKARNLGKLQLFGRTKSSSTKVLPTGGDADAAEGKAAAAATALPRKRMFAVDMVAQEEKQEATASAQAQESKLGGFSWTPKAQRSTALSTDGDAANDGLEIKTADAAHSAEGDDAAAAYGSAVAEDAPVPARKEAEPDVAVVQVAPEGGASKKSGGKTDAAGPKNNAAGTAAKMDNGFGLESDTSDDSDSEEEDSSSDDGNF